MPGPGVLRGPSQCSPGSCVSSLWALSPVNQGHQEPLRTGPQQPSLALTPGGKGRRAGQEASVPAQAPSMGTHTLGCSWGSKVSGTRGLRAAGGRPACDEQISHCQESLHNPHQGRWRDPGALLELRVPERPRPTESPGGPGCPAQGPLSRQERPSRPVRPHNLLGKHFPTAGPGGAGPGSEWGTPLSPWPPGAEQGHNLHLASLLGPA